MRYAMATVLIVTSTVATAALAQDGGGRGPPDIIIIMPQPLPVPTPSSPTAPVSKLAPPQQRSAPLTRQQHCACAAPC